MTEFVAQRIHQGKRLGDPILFEATADPLQPGDTDEKAAIRDANSGVDPFIVWSIEGRQLMGVWVHIRPKPKKQRG